MARHSPVQLSPVTALQLQMHLTALKDLWLFGGAVLLWHLHFPGVTKRNGPTYKDLALRTKVRSLICNWKC